MHLNACIICTNKLGAWIGSYLYIQKLNLINNFDEYLYHFGHPAQGKLWQGGVQMNQPQSL